jgi:hypothetical protein
MIKMLTAFTREVDDAQKAVSEIAERLAASGRLMKSSVGIMYYYPDFFETGVATAISDSLPFEVVGCTAPKTAVNEAVGEILLVVSVLTSDDVYFATGVTGSLSGSTEDAIGELYSRLVSAAPSPPAMVFSLFPIIDDISSDLYIESIDNLSNRLPIFGSIAFAPDDNPAGARTFYGGRQYKDALVMIAMCGALAPKFLITRIGEVDILTRSAVITESKGNEVLRINGMSAVSYLESVGLATGGKLDGITSMPMALTLGDGSRVIRIPYKTAGNGAVICFASTPQGAKVNFCRGDENYVAESATTLMKEIAEEKPHAVLLFSCIARDWVTGVYGDDTLQRFVDITGNIPFAMACSGGEICPVSSVGGATVNRLNNFSLIACLL